MRIKHIESFIVLNEELNISKACKRLFITQQGLSRQIQALEKELDVVLFQRSKNGVVPTKIGEKLYSYYKDIYETYSKSLDEVQKYKLSNSSLLSVGFAIGLSNATDTSFLQEFLINHPEIELNIFEFSKEECIEKLMKKELDLVFLVNPFDNIDFYSFPLAEGIMYAAMHKKHPLASYREPIEFSCLDGEKIITGSPQNSLRELFDYFCELTNIKPNIIISSSYSFSIINNMKEDKGIATVTSKMASSITNSSIVIKELKSPIPGYMYCCTLNKNNNSAACNLLVKYLKNTFTYPKKVIYKKKY